MFNTESSLSVVIVPDEKSKTTFEPFPVSTVCPSKIMPPTFTRSADKRVPDSLFLTETCPSMLAMIIAPFESTAIA